MRENSVKNMTLIYKWDYDGIYAATRECKKLYARFTNGKKILLRVIHKGKPYDYINHAGRIFYFF